MDKKTLSKDQLQQLVAYIKSRGFHDPLVVADILDHFACKVEEVIQANPGQSLAHAIEAAHNSFGVYGFHPLAEASKSSLKAKLSAIYKAEQKKLLTSANMLHIIALSAIFHIGYVWASNPAKEVKLFEYNLFTVFGYIGAMVCLFVFVQKFKSFSGLFELVNEATFKRDRVFWLPAIALTLFPVEDVHMPLQVLAASRTFIFMFVFFRQWAIYATLTRAISKMKVNMVLQ